MNRELRPLLESTLESEVRDVLASAQADGPSPEQLRSAAMALGLPAALVVTSAVATTTAAGTTSTAGAKLGLVQLLGKWFGSGIVAGLVTATTVSYVAGPSHEGARGAAPAAPAPAQIRDSVVAPGPGPVVIASARADGPAAQPKPSGVMPTTSTQLPDPPTQSEAPSVATFDDRAQRLRAETAVLDEARRALAQGRAEAALSVLAGYERRFVPAVLGPEARVVRVRALMQVGRRPEAQALVARALADRPNDVHALRLRRIVGLDAPSRLTPPPSKPSPNPSPSVGAETKPPTASF